MPTIPFRNLGEKGVVIDRSPQDADPLSWTNARNVRFAEGKISRYSAFKRLDATYSYSKQPVGILDASSIDEEGFIVTVFSDGTMEQWSSGAVTDVTPTGTLITDFSQITSCKLGQVTYVNRETDVPIYRVDPSDGAFQPIPGWNSGDRCRSLRSFKDFLIALDVTLGGTDYQTMVKWSDAAQAGSPPANWDTTSSSSLAGENVLNDLESSIVDGLALGDSFIIYTDKETVRMDYVDQPFIFDFNTVFNQDAGMIAKNCVVEVEGKHFVFGRSDIYAHDGVSKVSLVDGVIRSKVYSELDFDLRSRCFVYHDAFQNEIAFCYPSTADDAQWKLDDINGCNRAVVYNYRWQTWTVIDLPSIVGWTETSSSTTETWEIPENWSEDDSSWTSYVEVSRKNLMVTGTGNDSISKSGQPYYVDPVINGRLSNPVDTDVYWRAYAEKIMQDMDELGAPLMSTLSLTRLIPQAKTVDTDQSLRFQFGRTNQLSSDMVFSPEHTFNPWEDFKVDTRTSGRYLGLRFIMPAGVSGEFGGFDADIQVIARR